MHLEIMIIHIGRCLESSHCDYVCGFVLMLTSLICVGYPKVCLDVHSGFEVVSSGSDGARRRLWVGQKTIARSPEI